MPDLSIKEVPDYIYARLEEQAKMHGRSIDREALLCLASFLANADQQPGELLERIRETRSRLNGLHLTDADLEMARNEGRA